MGHINGSVNAASAYENFTHHSAATPISEAKTVIDSAASA